MKNLNWATGLTAEGRPIRVPDMDPTSRAGASARASRERRTGFRRRSIPRPVSITCSERLRHLHENSDGVGSRQRLHGRGIRQAPDEPAQRVLRAIDIQTGEIAWELPQPGPVTSWGGVLTTAGGMVIFGENSGSFMAADRREREAAVEFPDEPDLEGVADDVCVRQQAARCGRRRVGDYCVRVAGLIASGNSEDMNRLIGSGRSFRVPPLAKIRDGHECRGREPRDAFWAWGL